jgi:tetratricopeptide (TPR) repeat protein
MILVIAGSNHPVLARGGSVRRGLLLALVGLVAGLVAVGLHFWPERYLESARAALQRRDYVAARTSLLHYLEARPKSAEAHLLLAQLDRRSNRYDDAAAHLDTCRRCGGPSDAIDLERALCSVQSGVLNAESVKRCYDHLNREDADRLLILEALSQGFTKTYHLKEAMLCLERMLVLEPNNNYALRRRGYRSCWRPMRAAGKRARQRQQNDRPGVFVAFRETGPPHAH